MKEITQFLHEVKLEFSKVVWPKMNEWVGSTLIVLILLVIFSIYLGLVDKVLAGLVEKALRAYGL